MFNLMAEKLAERINPEKQERPLKPGDTLVKDTDLFKMLGNKMAVKTHGN